MAAKIYQISCRQANIEIHSENVDRTVDEPLIHIGNVIGARGSFQRIRLDQGRGNRQMVTHFSVSRKLYSCIGALLLLAFIVGASALYNIGSLSTLLHTAVTRTALKQRLAGEIATSTAQMLALDRGVLVRGFMKDAVTVEIYQQQFMEESENINKVLDTITPILDRPEAKQIVEQLRGSNVVLRDANKLVHDFVTRGEMESATKTYVDQFLPLSKQARAGCTRLVAMQQDNLAESLLTADTASASARWITGVVMVLLLLVSAGVIYIVSQINKVLGQNVMDLSDCSAQVTTTATQMASTSRSMAKDSSDQAAIIEQTSSSAEEINSMAKRNTESAQTATNLVNEAVLGTEQTNRAVADCVQAMDAIGESSTKIAKTLQVIDKIAFQTNILALNAAVEAARAGEAGMGFAVVAEEVRNLAQRCASASEEISTLIEQSLGNSDAGRIKMSTLVESGEKVNQVFASMKILVDEISISSQEQGLGIDQIGRAIQKMEQGTQKNAANAEESAAAAEDLNVQSESLRGVTSELGKMIGVAEIGSSRRPKAYRSGGASGVTSILPKTAPAKSRLAKPVLAMATPSGAFSMDDDSSFTEF
jgi:methyl-accepting chemotaxis protein